MTAFIDSSVLLRKLFRERGELSDWTKIEKAYASRLLPVEVGRVIDRVRLAGEIDDQQVADLQAELRKVLRSIEVRGLTEAILNRAGGPMPTVLGTLDSVHLATALDLAAALDEKLVFATHDEQLGRAARAAGFDVLGT